MEIVILLLVFIIIIRFLIANEFYKIAVIKGFSETKYFWFAFLFGIAGYLLIIALPNKKQQEVQMVMTQYGNKSSKEISEFEDDELPDL